MTRKAIGETHGTAVGVIGIGPSGSGLVERLISEPGLIGVTATIPRKGKSIEADSQSIHAALHATRNAAEVLIVAGLGGPWTSPTAQLVTQHLQLRNQRTHVFATLPFPFEGRERRYRAERLAQQLSMRVTTLYPLDLSALLSSMPDEAPFNDLVDRIADQLFEVYLRLISRRGT